MSAERQASSYNQILRSSSIVGGAQVANYAIALVRAKFAAVLLGPSGVGLIGLYLSTVGMVQTLAGLGVASSGVRDVANAHSSGDSEHLAHTVKALRRACWATGILGWILTAALAYPLSLWVMDSPKYAGALAILGSTVLLGAVSGGQTALIQGMRRIGDLARLNVLGGLAGTLISLPLYWWLGEKGIVPALVASAMLHLCFSWWLARRVQTEDVPQSLTQTVVRLKSLVGLGVAFMWSALLGAIVAVVIRAIVQHEFGLEGAGLYQSAWAISGMFAGFVLAAMGADFYPRLTVAKDDFRLMGQLVNEQTEVGVLLALPGLVGTLAFAPWVMRLLFTAEFLPAADLLPWFVLGVFGRVLSWPLGFIMLALGKGKWFAGAETIACVIHVLLAVVAIKLYSLEGVAVAFALLYAVNTVFLAAIAFHLIRFRWSLNALRVLIISAAFVALAMAVSVSVESPLKEPLGAVIVAVSAVYAMRGLVQLVGGKHRVTRAIRTLPGARYLIAK